MPVQTERADYAAIAPQWARCRDVYEGRDAVLKAGVKYVPALPGSDTGANQAYRERGTFYGATQRTIQGLVGAIFQKPPEVEFPEALADYLDDITLAGVAFEQFAADAGREIMLLGETFTAVEALEWRLIERVAPPSALDEAVEAWIGKLLTSAPRAVRLQKRLIRRWEDLPLAAAVQAGMGAFAEAYATDEPAAAMREFLDAQLKRKRNT